MIDNRLVIHFQQGDKITQVILTEKVVSQLTDESMAKLFKNAMKALEIA